MEKINTQKQRVCCQNMLCHLSLILCVCDEKLHEKTYAMYLHITHYLHKVHEIKA